MFFENNLYKIYEKPWLPNEALQCLHLYLHTKILRPVIVLKTTENENRQNYKVNTI